MCSGEMVGAPMPQIMQCTPRNHAERFLHDDARHSKLKAISDYEKTRTLAVSHYTGSAIKVGYMKSGAP